MTSEENKAQYDQIMVKTSPDITHNNYPIIHSMCNSENTDQASARDCGTNLCSGWGWKDEYMCAWAVGGCGHRPAGSLVVVRLHGVYHDVNVRMELSWYDTRAHDARHRCIAQLPTSRACCTQLLVACTQTAPTQNSRPSWNTVTSTNVMHNTINSLTVSSVTMHSGNAYVERKMLQRPGIPTNYVSKSPKADWTATLFHFYLISHFFRVTLG